MIILDTNILSEPLKSGASPAVLAWLDAQSIETLYLTTITLAELFVGIEILPTGKRQAALKSRLNAVLDNFSPAQILPFDIEAARIYPSLVNQARRSGTKISFVDGQIAAIARATGFTVATRDTQPFVAAGVKVINPWNLA